MSEPQRLRAGAGNLLAVIVSLSISLLAGEGLLRFFVHPIDVLVPEVLPDLKRSLRIRPYSAGHDARGCRNAFVPARADVVVVGDSQTYGVSTSAEASWPRVLGRGLGRVVYNLAVPGYNPVDYWSLVDEDAFAFSPSVIVVALYYGNDLREAFRSVYGKDYWRGLRSPPLSRPEILRAEAQAAAAPVTPERFLGGVRKWLSMHSVFYRMVTVKIRERLPLRPATPLGLAGNAVVFTDRERRISTVLTPTHRLGVLDLGDPKVEEGLRITLDMFHRMQERCSAHGVPMLAVLIPTKESVLWPYARPHTELSGYQELKTLVEAEQRVDARVTEAFARDALPTVGLLGPLREAAGREEVYPFMDGHPNARGCEVIAGAIQDRLIKMEIRPVGTVSAPRAAR